MTSGAKWAIKKAIKLVLIILLIFVLTVGGYVLYVVCDYSRIEDVVELEVENNQASILSSEGSYQITTYNVGFGAYDRDFTFFMDGGTQARGTSYDQVMTNITGAYNLVDSFDSDFVFLQEVDHKADRSYDIDQYELAKDMFSNMGITHAVNYDSSYLFYPFYEPIGASKASLVTLSNYAIESSTRYSFPIETGFSKFFDLDRCYSVSAVEIDNGKTLYLYNVHMSAYTSSGSTIKDAQVAMLVADMQSKVDAGDYVVCGGDFNQDLWGSSFLEFGFEDPQEAWSASFPFESLGEDLSIAISTTVVPTCRWADMVYDKETNFAYIIDGFIVSNNITIESCENIDNEFEFSDHNPVNMTFSFQ